MSPRCWPAWPTVRRSAKGRGATKTPRRRPAARRPPLDGTAPGSCYGPRSPPAPRETVTAVLTSPQCKENARRALDDAQLQRALGKVETGFIERRAAAVAVLPEFEALRDSARAIKNHTLEHLDLYLEVYERKVSEAGGQVHWAVTAEQARAAVLDICRRAGARPPPQGKNKIPQENGGHAPPPA